MVTGAPACAFNVLQVVNPIESEPFIHGFRLCWANAVIVLVERPIAKLTIRHFYAANFELSPATRSGPDWQSGLLALPGRAEGAALVDRLHPT